MGARPALAVVAEDLRKDYRRPTRHGLRGVWRPGYENVPAVAGITLCIQPGEAVALLGPNGAGKTTLIRLLSGILVPTSGSVRVLGLNPYAERAQLAHRIAVISGQRSQLRLNSPLRDSLDLAAEMYGVPNKKARIQEVVERLALGAFLDQRVASLSLGQRRRGEIAKALLHDAELVLMDEPTVGLDVPGQQDFRQLLRDINKQGVTVLLTSHVVGDIRALAERVVVVNLGRIVDDASMADLRRRYSLHKTIRITARRPPMPVRGVVPQIDPFDLLHATYVLDGSVPVEGFLVELQSAVGYSDITVHDMPLEDIIVDLFGSGAS